VQVPEPAKIPKKYSGRKTVARQSSSSAKKLHGTMTRATTEAK
jgi:hypothetical protein